MPTNVRLADYLQPAHIAVPLRARTLKQALHELLERLRASSVVRADPDFENQLQRTGARDIVSVGRGVVLPHFRTDAVEKLVVAMGVAPAPLDTTDSGVAAEARIVVLILAPPAAATLYLQTVAALARLFSQDDVVRAIANARTPSDITQLPALQTLRIEPQLTVRHVMTRDVTTIAPNATVRTVVDLMLERRARAVVVTGAKNEVLGILTEWDVMRALLPHIPRAGEAIEEEDDLTVREVMTRSVLCVPEEMGLPEAVNLMINKNAEQCPVVRDAELVGMLVRSEIIRKLFAR
ncbi:MAG TPA: CBS domain-containing protein [Longimicrobiales bacterium]|nr:CBS domain-containing protein [Longimicrobiales bacterium]